MCNFRKGLIASAIMTVAGVCSSQAADLAVRPYYTKAVPAMVASVYDWSGLYIGVNGGYATSHNCWSVDDPFEAGCHNATGATIGGQIGYRWQLASWVFGVEGQGNWADLSGSNRSTYVNAFGATNQTRINSLALVTAQVGYAVNNVLLFVKGGGAMVNSRYEYTSSPTDPYGNFHGTASESRWNPAVGAGVEFAFAPNWTIGAEYNHVFRSNKDEKLSCTGTYADNYVCGCASDGLHVRQGLDMALVRLNYRFGGPTVLKY
ncbi:MAG: outer membrane beta-barrel protein [Alphaproteobacteria bacterium]|nr:outer membrane beta-barrel protein [Alphaproteobacteria bacterium]